MMTVEFITALFYEVDERSCSCSLRLNTLGSPVDRLRGKKAETRGLAWLPSSSLTSGDAPDANRADAPRLLRPPPLTASTTCAHRPTGCGHGGTRKSRTSRMLQTWSVNPAAMAGVQGRHCLAEPAPLVARGCGNGTRKLTWGKQKL